MKMTLTQKLSFVSALMMGALLTGNPVAVAAAANHHEEPKPALRSGGNRQLGSASQQCPKVSPLTASEFNLDTFIAKSWFVQKQQVNPYQSEEQLYCVVATYDRSATYNGFLQVKNYGNNNEVNGPAQNSDDNGFFGNLCGRQVEGGELQVAPCAFRLFFNFVAGPYWVLAVANDYSWAIVSGGPPDQVRSTNPTLCTTKEGSSFLDINGSGLWLFTREKVASAETVQAMETKLIEMGIYTGDLKVVTQQGCDYRGTTLKE